MFTKQFFVRPLAWAMIVLLAAPPAVLTQQPAAPPAASTQQPAAPPTFKQEELDQILAPIALYPDSLVAQILMASTFPLEVVQAERFAKQNASLKGEALTKQLESQSWDPSVKSLVNFPQVLTMMNEKLDWTQKLGDAFIAQQKPVLDTIQSLRAKAQAAGNLKTTKEQTVIVEQKIIKIEPAESAGDLCADLQSHGGVWRLGVSCLSALLLLSSGICGHDDCIRLCIRSRLGRRLGLRLGQYQLQRRQCQYQQ